MLSFLFMPRPQSSLLVLFCSSLIISIVFAVIPLCTSIIPLLIVIMVVGIAMGFIDTIGNRQLLWIYGKDSATFLQVRPENLLFKWLPVFSLQMRPHSHCYTVGSSTFHLIMYVSEVNKTGTFVEVPNLLFGNI